MSAPSATPQFWTTPIRYMRYSAHTSPAIFFSIAIGLACPLILLAVPIRHRLGFNEAPHLPKSWPIPNRKREAVPAEFDDPQ
ncbi:hypothetical protein BZA05DRAFT_332675 [Tricharina praecox]|uniref:uncharacterized protein n=1 Tax=Tricharina praecox TaxID=43433 RepID=UPI00221E60F6|nr:uncharacterized protein BZA05DRAFT_332675 [Tricharina praecox]KAI5856506.1 hypothetical protein BZA05DRAFT_332675 [Tricharina praecox]